ncbi:hypothetical protein H1P_830003 [Hyella patelloides LEGE 07179]|uniref:Uncharacterized protein n=1 Tax=Hyella patelloides LEGE 07179 TaxID=945734 RepID=A0A563W4I4_9CYAN|nr:hypothetical protein H1P_830003 [Hyella patelloides LEGE 07179]
MLIYKLTLQLRNIFLFQQILVRNNDYLRTYLVIILCTSLKFF